ncbi:unnamed protein product [Brassica rapa]|uniref:DUF223 domain-containing protein n=1 Tax=Brassica campestris TaxID=3711 RepID=A0A8D9HG17_BRACM|nr:unnamed protein product [Brassica rapa]
MGISQLYISDLEIGRFEDVVVTRLLQFWESTSFGTITAHRLYSSKNLLSESAVYELSVFDVSRSNNHFKLCASPVCIRFTEHTSFFQVYISDIFRQDRSIHTIYNDENESIQRVMVTIQLDRYVAPTQAPLSRLVLNVTLGTQFYFYHESQATQYAGSAEQRVVPLVYLPKYGGVKKLEYVRLSKLNIYVLNSPLQHHTSDDMSVAVKLSMVPNPLVKSSCSYHTNGPDDVPIIEGCPASTDPEPAHTDSVLTSTETPIDDEKAPVQSKLEILITPTMETWNLQNSIQLFVSKFYVFFNNVVIHILLLSTKVFLSTYLWYSAI